MAEVDPPGKLNHFGDENSAPINSLGRWGPPIDRVPNEILSIVFEQNAGFRISWRDLPCEIKLSHVSQRWRELALNSPNLWRNITVYSIQQEDLIEQYLERSQSQPLDVTLAFSGVKGLIPVSGLASIFSHVHRWHSLCADVSRDDHELTQHLLWAIHNLQAPLLKSLQICSSGSSCDAEHPDNCVFEGGAPLLEKVKILGQHLPCCHPPLEIVTHFHFGSSYTTSFRFHKMLLDLPSVTNLRLQGVCFVRFQDDNTPPVDLPHLRTLIVEGTIAAIFFAISAPALENLIIVSGKAADLTSTACHLQAPSPIKFPALQFLEFWYTNMPIYAALEFIRSLPTVAHFALIECGPDTDYIPLLLSGRDENQEAAPCWPDLKSFTLYPAGDRCSPEIKFVTSVVECVSARAAANAPLSKLRLHPILHNAASGMFLNDECLKQVELEVATFLTRDGRVMMDWDNYLA
jgi:hypothetical protein